MGFAKFMASGFGRAARAIIGLALVVLAITQFVAGAPVLGAILGVVGLFFMAVGIFNICVLAPLFGGPLNGAKVGASK